MVAEIQSASRSTYRTQILCRYPSHSSRGDEDTACLPAGLRHWPRDWFRSYGTRRRCIGALCRLPAHPLQVRPARLAVTYICSSPNAGTIAPSRQIPYAIGQFTVNEFCHELVFRNMSEETKRSLSRPAKYTISLGSGIVAGFAAAILSQVRTARAPSLPRRSFPAAEAPTHPVLSSKPKAIVGADVCFPPCVRDAS